jgi:hypothetical protein
MINVYAKRTRQERDAIRSLLANETWMTAEEAVENGFADEVRGVVKAAASLGNNKVIFNGVTHDLSRFHNVPAFRAQKTKTKGVTNMAEPTTTDEPTPAPTPSPAPDPTPEPNPSPPNPSPSAEPAATVNDFHRGELAERERVMALQKLDRPCTHAIVMAAIKDGKTVVDITADVIDAMDKANKQSLRHVDASVLGGIPPANNDLPEGEPTDPTGFRSRIAASVAAKLKEGRKSVLNSRN